MLYDLCTPCGNCPFLREGGVRLMAARVREIAGAMLDRQGKTFACHKTTIDCEHDEGDDGDACSGRHEGQNTRHCAGALIFAEKNGNATQMMRIAERLRMYDARKLTGQDRVFDTLDEMMATSWERRRRPARRAGARR